VISMARGQADSATSGWFICINDQPSLDYGGARNPDGQGFAAFGRVVQGMDVVRKIQQAPNTDAQRLTPPIKILKVSVIR
jgi:Peptidyl-prolyl cis-trans isomerase (rotamase) - cyclophilin family